MFLRPDGRDLRIIGFYLGKIAMALAMMMGLPALLAIVLGEWDAAVALLTGTGIAAAIWQAAEWRLRTRASLTWAHGTVVVALAWLLGSVLAAVPLMLSGHVADFLDAWFETMSGLTTSGLSVVQDLDHLSHAMNFYRHLTHFAGGQGIVIVALSLFSRGGASIGTLFVAEGRDERIVPSVVRTARFIYLIAGTYLVAGTLALTAAMWTAGIGGWRGLWHAVNLFMAAFDTGGFSPASSSIVYYHSAAVEAVLTVLMLAGMVSFALHYALWSGRRGILLRNLEVRTLALTMVGLAVLTVHGLVRAGTFDTTAALVRKGLFTLVSAHSGTGFAVNHGALYVTDWGMLAPAAVVTAMALGGMAGSTAGGIKMLRIGLAAKGLMREVRRLLQPESAVTVATYHSGKQRIVTLPLLSAATTVLLLYVLTYLAGALVGLLYGSWDVTETIFESVSAAANVGLSVGITSPDMPAGLQVTYILQMWLGRLEFMAAFAMVGYAISLVGSRR